MLILEFDGQTKVLNAPPGWNDHEPIKCGMLPIREVKLEGMPAMQSFWKPELDERVMLANGAHVCLTVYGTGHPPVWVGVERCPAVIERVPGESAGSTGAKITRAVFDLNLHKAVTFLAVTIHRDERGEIEPTLTIVADSFSNEHVEELRAHLRALFDTLRKVYAPKPHDSPTTADAVQPRSDSMSQDQDEQQKKQDTTEQQSETNKTQADVNKQQAEQNESKQVGGEEQK